MEEKTEETMSGNVSLKQSSTKDLLDEIERRSLACLCVSTRIESGENDVWRYRVKGSGILLGALTAALQIEVNSVLEKRAEENDGDPLLANREE